MTEERAPRARTNVGTVLQNHTRKYINCLVSQGASTLQQNALVTMSVSLNSSGNMTTPYKMISKATDLVCYTKSNVTGTSHSLRAQL